MTKIEGSGSISQRHGSADPDPPQNIMDPQHCYQYAKIVRKTLIPTIFVTLFDCLSLKN
jgi:hypothetical protein